MRILVSLLACALVLTGCSGGDTDDATRGNTNAISQSPSSSSSVAPSRWAVVGVERGDRLNVRRQPMATAQVLGRLAPLASGVKVGSRTSGAWRQVRVPAGVGWAHGRYLAMLGKSVDVSAEARDVGIAPTRRALARKVATRQAEAGDGPLVGPVVVARKGATFTVDVLGYADDAVRGERFVVVVVPGEAGFEVGSATAIPMCARSVDSAGLCA